MSFLDAIRHPSSLLPFARPMAVPAAPKPTFAQDVFTGASGDPGPRKTAKGPGWTVAVNLAASLRDPDGNLSAGAVVKRRELMALAASTRGKAVTLVVNVTLPGEGEAPAKLERYVIQDGVATKDPAVTTAKGYAEDLRELVAAAGKRQTGDRLAVVSQSHGDATEGMLGDGGEATLQELTAALKAGLKQAGRKTADVVSFDACLMGQDEVLGAMQGVADHVVASSETEAAEPDAIEGGADGQNLKQTLIELIAHPELDGNAFAKKFVAVAATTKRFVDRNHDGIPDADEPAGPPMPAPPPPRRGATIQEVKDLPPAEVTGTQTLASYDLKARARFRQALDGLGDRLASLAADPAQLAVLKDVIRRTRHYGAEGGPTSAASPQADVKDFARGIIDALDSGRLRDAGGLRAAAQKVLDARRDVVTAYQGSSQQDYDRLGGLGVFLPGDAYFDLAANDRGSILKALAHGFVPGGWIHHEQDGPDLTDGAFLGEIAKALPKLEGTLPHALAADAVRLNQLVADVKAAKTPREKQRAARLLRAGALKLEGSAFEAYLTSRGTQLTRERMDSSFQHAQGNGQGGWNRFTRALKEKAAPLPAPRAPQRA
ncbi:MAG: peptidase clostripain [Cyanobacteria bacterium RYN_339]|nr:peptidase clostripain [Cyanobacteria bacterium RYN_339]